MALHDPNAVSCRRVNDGARHPVMTFCSSPPPPRKLFWRHRTSTSRVRARHPHACGVCWGRGGRIFDGFVWGLRVQLLAVPAVGAELLSWQSNRLDHVIEPLVPEARELEPLADAIHHGGVEIGIRVAVYVEWCAENVPGTVLYS
jgi:hypothetical protein